MLALTRKVGSGDQSILKIGDDITVSVVEVSGGQVRLGIKAPQDISVHRTEVYHQVQAEKLAAGEPDGGRE